MAVQNSDNTLPPVPEAGGGPAEAAAEIAEALALIGDGAATPDQLADLADAVDAFRDGRFHVARLLARAATAKRRALETHRRPQSMSRTVKEIRESFAQLTAEAQKSAPER